MRHDDQTTTDGVSETGARVDAVREWRSGGAAVTGAWLLFETVTGVAIYAGPFAKVTQFGLLLHTVLGLVVLPPVLWYLARHWWVRRRGRLSHYQLLGYTALAFLLVCIASGFVVTWNGIAGPRLSRAWDLVHLVSSIGAAVFVVVHVAMLIGRAVNNAEARRRLAAARGAFMVRSGAVAGLGLVATVAWSATHRAPDLARAFPASYEWRFGEDRPFAPSLARIDHDDWRGRVERGVVAALEPSQRTAYLARWNEIAKEPIGDFEKVARCTAELGLDAAQQARIDALLAEARTEMRDSGAIAAATLARSANCATAGCHTDVYDEWAPSAHRFSSLDEMFQQVQTLMVRETSPEHTRYCAGCHDPISLFSGAKNHDNITLSAEGADEGTSCLVCHSIVQTDVQGNGDYTIAAQVRYVYELDDGPVAKAVSDFLIRTYPRHHVVSYSRPLYKTPEFCGACHKQYLDKEVNTDIGKVQGQNQYDSWKNSRWHVEGDPEHTISCRECHMPLVPGSSDPAAGDVIDPYRAADDGAHRSHRMLASNQYIPVLQDLPGAAQHVALTERWLRGEYEIPEIAHKWTSGPVVRMQLFAPDAVLPGTAVPLQIVLTNNKTGHDFPTGPLDMIESWIEITVTTPDGAVVHHRGGLDEVGRVEDTPVWFKADEFDRAGEAIDRHNLWDLVGVSYKRSLYPGVTDTQAAEFFCPSMARGRVADDERQPGGMRTDRQDVTIPADLAADELVVKAVLWYRKANPEFLDRVYGVDSGVRAPATAISDAEIRVRVDHDASASSQ